MDFQIRSFSSDNKIFKDGNVSVLNLEEFSVIALASPESLDGSH